MIQKKRKIAVLGTGNVGATIAYTLTLQGIASEIVLVDINKEKAEGEELDLIEKNVYKFCWIVDFPMFELDEETGEICFSHNPFSH